MRKDLSRAQVGRLPCQPAAFHFHAVDPVRMIRLIADRKLKFFGVSEKFKEVILDGNGFTVA